MHGLQSLADEFATEPFGDEEPRQRVDVLLSIREILRQRYMQESRRRAADSLPDETSSRDRHFLERVVAGHYTDPDFSMSGFASLMAMGEREL